MKKCPFCGTELPKEASFCLKCASMLNTREVFESNGEKTFLLYKKNITVFLLVLFAFSLCFLSSTHGKGIPTAAYDSENSGTTLIPVTLPNGEAVTDTLGNAVYTSVTVEPTTQKPSSAEQDRNNFSEAADADNSTADSHASTQNHAQTEPAAEKETGAYEDPREVFEYKNYNSPGTQIAITKYKGNASFVTIPVYIDGKMIVQIETNAFQDNSKIKTIDIPKGERSSIFLSDYCFHNLSALTTVNLYDNVLDTTGNFAVDCPIKNINITYQEYKFVDGALYTQSYYGWAFIYFAGNPCYTTLTVPSWCTEIDSGNLKTAKNLKVINAHKNVTYFPKDALDYNKSLEAINVEEGNSRYFSKDGVFFCYSYSFSYTYTYIYPYSKKDKSFTFPQKDEYSFKLEYLLTGCTNPYVEEFYLPLNAHISYSTNYTNSFPKLKKLHFAKGHADYENIKSKFPGEVTLY